MAEPPTTPSICEGIDSCGSCLLLSLPDDVLLILTVHLQPRDLCSLSLCCRSLNSLASSDKLWLVQCSRTHLLPPHELPKWRSLVSSYRALCRFLIRVRPILGIWVHQNPELGNVVFAMLGFGSVIGCRIIPQELGPEGIEDSPLLWAPVFEILAESDGSTTFFLHGRESDADHFYPGTLKSIDPNCNVLLLEVEPILQTVGSGATRKLMHAKSTCHSQSLVGEGSRMVSRSDSGICRSRRVAAAAPTAAVPFGRLAFGDRRKLLELVANRVRIKVPGSLNGRPMFPRLGEFEDGDLVLCLERRSLLIQMHKLGGGCTNWRTISGLNSDGTQMGFGKMKKILERPGTWNSPPVNWDEESVPVVEAAAAATTSTAAAKRKTVAGYFKDGLKQILGRSNSMNGSGSLFSKGGSSSSNNGSESKHVQLQEFLRASDSIGLSLRASYMKLTCYRAWPNMHHNHFALYKLPLLASTTGKEFTGLWGGSFGWPPGRPTEDKPGKALFFILISYEESEGQRILIATKILEGTHYVLHPNGSAMFIVKVDEPSSDPFPWDMDGNSVRMEIKNAYIGEGIANGYGFRYPGSKPGSLFVLQNELLAFVWKETRAVLTLQRLDLQELLKKGEQVPALPPIANFAYLTKSYSNVFAGFSITSSSLPYPSAESRSIANSIYRMYH